jgi:glycine cleavage system aminomethyltransferase T/glycine/D-amino acid oxidase-like deaminating enzyme
MLDQARVVIIGGGITGCSIAYHLAKEGWTDVVLVEKGDLTSGSTSQAAGLVTQFNTSPTMMRFRKYSIDLYVELGLFQQVGSLRIASSKRQLESLKRNISQARGIGLEVELLSPEEAFRIMPSISTEEVYGAVYLPQDGQLDPHGATYGVANAAKALGVRMLTDTRVMGIELSPKREVTRVITDKGNIKTEIVINAAGIWAPRLAAMVGLSVPSTPIDHQHIALKAVPGNELPADMPCFRDPDNLVYGRAEAGGVIFGGYEPNPTARWVDGVPWDHGARSLPGDMDRFEQLMEGAIRRFPFLDRAQIIHLVCHPDALTPDANPLMGPMPGVRGFWMAAGLSLNGFGGAGGIGSTIAEWIIDGTTSIDVTKYHAWRFSRNYDDPLTATEAARECYKYYYRLLYPYDEDEFNRPRRLSPVYYRCQEGGAVFGKKNGWERVNYYEPGKPWRRAGADQREFGFVKPPYFDLVGQEHQAIRERVGLIDMTSFGKFDISGPGAAALMQRVTDSNVDKPVGKVIYTQFLNKDGGVEADLTVLRLAEDCYRVVTGAGFLANDMGWVTSAIREGDQPVTVRDVTDEYAVVGMWGPKAREVLASVTGDDMSNAAHPYMTARVIHIGGAEVLASRVTYVGELGWELYVENRWAEQVWDMLWEAGQKYGIALVGYKALDSLRLEKGYKYFTADVTPLENPYEAGLGFCVHLESGGDFIGKDALKKIKAAGSDKKLSTIVIGGEDYLTVYGGEAVKDGDTTLGRLRSAGYGYSVRKNIGYVYLPLDKAKPGTKLEVEVFGEMVPAEVAPDVLYDPRHEHLKS